MSMYAESLRAFLRPITPYLDDPTVSEILILGPREVWIEQGGKLRRAEGTFTEESLGAAARNMAQYVGRVLNDERPQLDARLPDGSRIHVVLAPISRKGTTIAIRKFSQERMSMQRLLDLGSVNAQLARLLEAAIGLKLNVVVAGGSGSGKTTLLNVVTQYIPEDERVVTIEEAAELQLLQPQVISLEARPADKFGKGEVSLGDLLHSSLRLRPDRILVGEVRGGECFHLLQAMNTGHGGSLTTTHANTPPDTLRRLESLCLLSGYELPLLAVRAQVASAVNLVVVCERFSDGSRKITHVSEVLPLDERGDYRTQDLFVYTPLRKSASGRVQGYHAPTGILPTFLPRLAANDFGDLDETFFDPATWRVAPPPQFQHGDPARTRWAPSLRHRETGGAPEMEPFPLPVFEDDPEEDFTPAAATTTRAPRPAPEPPALEPSAALTPEPLPASAVLHIRDEPTIQLAADLLEEAEQVVSDEPTNVKRNPLLDAPPARDDKTDPHIRVPR